MPEMDGFEFQKKVQEKFNLPIVSEYCFELEFSFFIIKRHDMYIEPKFCKLKL